MTQQGHQPFTRCPDIPHIKLESTDDETTTYNAEGSYSAKEEAKKLDTVKIIPRIKQEVNFDDDCASDVSYHTKPVKNIASGQWEAVWLTGSVPNSSMTSLKPECSEYPNEMKQEEDQLPSNIKTEIIKDEQKECNIDTADDESNSNADGYELEGNLSTRSIRKTIASDSDLNIYDYPAIEPECILVKSPMRLNTESNVIVYKSEGCDFTSKDRSSLDAHVNDFHRLEGRGYKCSYSPKAKHHFADYATKYDAVNCVDKCGDSLDGHEDESYSRVDAQKLNCNLNNVYECRKCEYSTNNSSCYVKHVRVKHKKGSRHQQVNKSNANIYDCKTTRKDYSKNFQDKNVEPYKCNACDCTYKYKKNLTKHIKQVHILNAEIFKCKDCEYTTKYKYLMENHMYTHDPNYELYKCKECDYTTKYKYSLTTHTKHLHNPDVQVYKCTECNYTSKYKGSMTKHIALVHGKIYKCKQCDFQNTNEERYNNHINNKHDSNDAGYKRYPSNERLYKCDGCNYIGADESSLRDHLRANRFKESEIFLCIQCNYSTKIRRHLRFHISSVHGPPPDVYKCPSCDFESKRKGDLLLHTMTSEKCAKSPP